MARQTVTQCEKIMRYMRQHGSITQREALYLGCMRLASRINELRQVTNIKTEMIKVKNADGSFSIVASYSLDEGGESND